MQNANDLAPLGIILGGVYCVAMGLSPVSVALHVGLALWLVSKGM